MGIWAGIKYALNSTLGTTGFKSLDTLITESKNAILADGAIKSIKSVQSGYTHYNSSRNYNYNDITISAVDTSKCIVLLNGAAGYNNNSSYFAVSALPAFSFASNNSLRIYATGKDPYSEGSDGNISWQVIEFY